MFRSLRDAGSPGTDASEDPSSTRPRIGAGALQTARTKLARLGLTQRDGTCSRCGQIQSPRLKPLDRRRFCDLGSSHAILENTGPIVTAVIAAGPTTECRQTSDRFGVFAKSRTTQMRHSVQMLVVSTQKGTRWCCQTVGQVSIRRGTRRHAASTSRVSSATSTCRPLSSAAR